MTYLESTATVSECGRYRYTLRRVWDSSRYAAVFVMLNPSTADGMTDDPTIRKCVGFAERWGCGSLTVVNLFAFRATAPKDMFASADPVGPGNDVAILAELARERPDAPIVVAAWGANVTKSNRPVIRDRPFAVRTLFAGVPLKCLGLTGCGNPWHPLMVGYATELKEYGARPCPTTR